MPASGPGVVVVGGREVVDVEVVELGETVVVEFTVVVVVWVVVVDVVVDVVVEVVVDVVVVLSGTGVVGGITGSPSPLSHSSMLLYRVTAV